MTRRSSNDDIASSETITPAEAIASRETIKPEALASGETITPAEALASGETITPAEARALGETVATTGARIGTRTPPPGLDHGDDGEALGPTVTPAEAAGRTHSVNRRRAQGVLPEIARATYAVRRELARGGMGRILVADDSRLGRRVALKELISRDRGLQRRFAREVHITARLQHPGIVPVYEAGHWPDGEPFYAMKLVAGTSLEKVVENKPELEERLRLVPNLLQLTEAIAYAHDNGVIHRDLKPANVLVGAYGETVVIDWGLAKELSELDHESVDDSISPASTGMTMHGAVVGTPAYMPPEQARGDTVDARADVYSLGALMWHVLAGRPPYQGTIDDVLEHVRTRPPPALANVAPGVPAELATIVEHAMERDPDLRYPTARELAAELSRFQTGQLVTRHDYTTWQLFRRWVKRHRAAVMSGAALLVGAGVVAVIAMGKVVAERDRARATSLAVLEDQGRRELVEGHPLRASVFLSAAYRGGRSDEALRLMLGEAMRAVDANAATWTAGAWITHLAWASKDRLVTVADDGTVTVWDVSAMGDAARTAIAGDPVRPISIAIADTGSRLAVLGETALRIVDLGTNTATLVKLAQFGPTHVAMLPGADAIVVEGQGGVRVYGPDGTERSQPPGAPAPTAFMPDSTYVSRGATVTRLVTADEAAPTAFQVTDAAGMTRPFGRRDDAATYPVAAIDRAGNRFAAGTDDGRVRLWDVTTGLPLASFDGHTRAVRAVAFDPLGARLASAGDDGVVRVWDLATPAFSVPAPSAAPSEVTAASLDGNVRVVARLNEVLVGDRTLRGLEEVVSWVDTDGATIVAGARDGRVMQWDTASGRELGTWELASAITAGDVGRSGAFAVGTRDGSARIYLDAGTPIRLEGHATSVHAIAWHPTRRELLSSADTAVRVWSDQGKLLRYLSAGERVGRAWWSTDGNWVIVDGESSLQIWDGAHGALLLRQAHGLAPQLVPPSIGTVYGARDDAGLISRLGATGFVAWSMPRETRPTTAVAATVADRVPWRLAGGELVPAGALATVRSEGAARRSPVVSDFSGETIEARPSAPAIPLTLSTGAVAAAMRAIESGDREAARNAIAAVTDTRDPRNAYEVAWCWHYVGDEQAAYTMALRAWNVWPDAATKPLVLGDVLRFAAWGEIGHETVVAALGPAADAKARLALALAYDDLGRFALVKPVLETIDTKTDEWETRLRGLYVMARRAYLRGDFKIASTHLEVAVRVIPPDKMPTVTLGPSCGDVPVPPPPLDLHADAAASIAELAHALARDSFRTFSKSYDHRFALAARRLYTLLGDKFGVPQDRVAACHVELGVLAAASFATPGAVDKSLLRSAFNHQHTALTTCYQREVDSNPATAGRVMIRLDVSTNGHVASVETYPEPETPAMQSLATCVQAAIAKLDLPRQTFENRMIAHYPITFARAR